MTARIEKIDRRLRQAQAVLAQAARALEEGDRASCEAWCRDLAERLERVQRDILELHTSAYNALSRREAERLRRTHPR